MFISLFALFNCLLVTNLFVVYMLLEIVTICFFSLFFSGNFKANEFALKFFIYAFFTEGLFLFAISLLYISLGTADITAINALVRSSSMHFDFLLLLAFFLLVLSLLFKIGIFPFHFYILDLYEVSSPAAVLVFSTYPKIAYFYLLNLIYS